MNNKDNTYHKSTEYALKNDIKERLDKHYERLFLIKHPSCQIRCATIPDTNLEKQFAGIDRLIFCSSGTSVKKYKIEEKIRSRFYNDFLFEYISNDTQKEGVKRIGWIEKDYESDYLAYYFEKEDKLFFLSWPIIKKLWNKNKKEWFNLAKNNKNGFKIIKVFNKRGYGKSYNSWNITIPSNILLHEYKSLFFEDKLS